MKKLKLLSLVLIMFLIFLTIGCGKKNDAAGTYKGIYTKFVADTDDSKNTEDEFSLVLNEDGTGSHNRDGETYKVTYTVDGEKFNMTETFLEIKIEYTGTLKDGKLDLFNGNPEEGFTLEYVYEKSK